MAQAEQTRLSPAERFIERIGLACEEEGMSRTAGRMLGLFFLEEGPFGLDDMADRLQVSHASVSTNARLLESRGFVNRVSRPGERRVKYRLAADPHSCCLESVIKWKKHWVDVTRTAIEELPADRREARGRLRKLQKFHELTIQGIEGFLHKWQQEHGA